MSAMDATSLIIEKYSKTIHVLACDINDLSSRAGKQPFYTPDRGGNSTSRV